MKNRIRPTGKQRQRLLKKDGFACCVCHERGIGLDLHHIDGNPLNTIDDNLAVLCKRDHDANHRPDSYETTKHTELGPEKILESKIKWERFIEETKKEKPQVVGVITSYCIENIVESFTLIFQWVNTEVVLVKNYSSFHGPMGVCLENAVDYIESFSRKIKWTFLSEEFEKEYCPHCPADTYNHGFIVLPEEVAKHLANSQIEYLT